MGVTIVNKTRRRLPSLPFNQATAHVLGADYDLSLVFVGDKTAQRLNSVYRNKTYIPNVLSFPLSETSGEIFINLNKALSQADEYDMTGNVCIFFLFIHSLLHLKGYDHGSTMDRKERELLRRFVKHNVKNNRMRD